MARKRLAVTKDELVKVIGVLEGTADTGKKSKSKKHGTEPVSPFTNRTQLFAAMLETDWAKEKIANGVNLTAQNLYSSVLVTHKIPIITPAGQRGRKKGEKIPNAGRKKREFNQEVYDRLIKMLESHGDRANTTANRKLALKVAKGSKDAAIRLKCKECNGFESGLNELIRTCNSSSCPIWSMRPYQAVEPEVVQIGLPAPIAAVA